MNNIDRKMIINAVAHYFPSKVLDNKYFSELNGLSTEDIYSKSGIIERRVATDGENTNTMAIEAVERALPKLPFHITEVDLIIGGTYSPFDTVGTLAHAVQKKYSIENAIVTSVSSACSTFINAVEIAEGYFATGKASKALIVVSEHNSAYNDESNPISGHLWGDGAAAVFISKEKHSETDIEILDIYTRGLAHVGKGPDGVYNRPFNGKIQMPDGRNVFINAGKYMSQCTSDILKQNGYTIDDLKFLVPHQANIRIIESVAFLLEMDSSKVLVNLDKLGNTGCASSAIALSENIDLYQKDDIIVVIVFGGGYSCGAMLLKKL